MNKDEELAWLRLERKRLIEEYLKLSAVIQLWNKGKEKA